MNETMSIPQDDDDWGNGKTMAEMRDLCPNPALTAHLRNNPVELAAVEAGLDGWDAWGVYDGNYIDHASGLHLSPNTGDRGWQLTYHGDEFAWDDPDVHVSTMREFCSAYLAITASADEGSGEG